MIQQKILLKIFEEIKNTKFNSLFTQEDIIFINTKLSSIRTIDLYKSEFHGLFHSQKVMIFAYLISKKLQLNDKLLKIILDAAMYHDIGRINDFEESTHGLVSARKFDRFFLNDDFYNDVNNLSLLKSITDGHSREDTVMNEVFCTYELNDELYDEYVMLYKILKDSDALDRARFSKNSSATLKNSFLRYDFSKELIDFTFWINDMYKKIVDEIYFNKNMTEYLSTPKINACIHGIGFDFSKLESILDSGILSTTAALNKGIELSRNFQGNNCNPWISVIDSKDVSKQGQAYKLFVESSICLYSFVRGYKEGIDSKSKAFSNSLPAKSPYYSDEKFVMYEIPPEDIYCILLPSIAEKLKLKDLNYFCCSSGYNIITDRVKHYHEYLKLVTGMVFNTKIVDGLVHKLKNIEIDYENQTIDFQRQNRECFVTKTEELVKSINVEVANWISIAFKCYFSLSEFEEPTLYMVVEDILKRKAIDFSVMKDDNCEYIFKVNLKSEEIGTKKRI